MSNPLISVIVPVYKADPYLQRCVDSIRNQTYSNLEIILVDDGSPDRCGEMCDAFAKEDKRIRVFHKENGGQSSARNLGLDNITGTYVGFVDSDDWIEPDMYEHLHDILVTHNAQISCCGTQIIHRNGHISYFNSAYPDDTLLCTYTTEQALDALLLNQKITNSLCDKLFTSEIFVSLRMQTGRIYEDMEIMPKCLDLAKRIVYDPVPHYSYEQTEDSTMRSAPSPRQFAATDFALARAAWFADKYPQLYPQAYSTYVAIALDMIHKTNMVNSCSAHRSSLVQDLQHNIPADMRQHLSRNTAFKLAVLRVSPCAYEVMMFLYDKIRKVHV